MRTYRIPVEIELDVPQGETIAKDYLDRVIDLGTQALRKADWEEFRQYEIGTVDTLKGEDVTSEYGG